MNEPVAWIDRDALRVPKDDLQRIAGQLSPPVEMRVLTICREARYENIVLAAGDGIYQVTEPEFEHIIWTLDPTGALWRSRMS